jgi:hypothetical protein
MVKAVEEESWCRKLEIGDIVQKWKQELSYGN